MNLTTFEPLQVDTDGETVIYQDATSCLGNSTDRGEQTVDEASIG